MRCKWQRSTPNLEVLSWITLAAIKTLCQGTRETSEAPYSPQLCMGKLGCASALTWSVYPVQCACRCVSSCRWLLGQVWTSGYWSWTVTSQGEMSYSDPPNPLKHWQLLTFKCFKKKKYVHSGLNFYSKSVKACYSVSLYRSKETTQRRSWEMEK